MRKQQLTELESSCCISRTLFGWQALKSLKMLCAAGRRFSIWIAASRRKFRRRFFTSRTLAPGLSLFFWKKCTWVLWTRTFRHSQPYEWEVVYRGVYIKHRSYEARLTKWLWSYKQILCFNCEKKNKKEMHTYIGEHAPHREIRFSKFFQNGRAATRFAWVSQLIKN